MAMKRRWFELLLGLGALHSSTATSASPSSSVKQPLTFYVNKPPGSIPDANRAIQTNVQTARNAPGPQSERKLVFDAYDSRRALDDWDLEDYVLVATIEGSLYALDRQTGATKWKLEGNEPAVRTVGNSRGDPEPVNNTEGAWAGGQQPRWIVQPVEGGQLFLFDPEFGVLELPLTIKQLIDHGAFKIPGDDKVYTGKKETQLVAVDSKNGKILSQFGPRSTSFSEKCRIPGDPLDELDDECDAAVEGDVLMIGKTVYHLTITSGDGTRWDVTYSEWTPNMIDSHLTDLYQKVQDDLYICPSSDGLIYMHNPSHESALWTKNLASAAINAFDVFKPSFENPSMFKDPPSLVLIRQPPSPFFHKPSESVTTFLNTTEEGAWYALSTERYPLLTSRVRAAPWISESHQGENRNVSKDDLIGIHPIARTVEVNIDNPGLPAPNMPKLIEGGDWENRHQVTTIRENPLLFLAALGIFLLAIWKRQLFSSAAFGRRAASVQTTNVMPQENVSIDKSLPPLPVSKGEFHTESEGIVEAVDTLDNDEGALAVEKKPRRKRGQRGGKNNKKKVGFVEPTTDLDEENEATDVNGFVHVTSPKEPLRDDQVNDQGIQIIDGLTVTDKLLGSGSQGTFVYEGTWENIKVAVKRMQIENFEIADKEVDHLRESDEHPNIVRYYTNKRSDKFIYIALELCPATLEQVIVHGSKEPFCQLAGPNLQKQYALAQIASGLQFLHSLKIVHRDLKPQNILVAPPKLRHATTGSPLWRHYKQDQTRCLISDFGLCKKLEPDHSTFQAQSTMAAGTSGWRAPEVLRGVENEKKGLPSGVTSDTTVLVPGSDRRITRAVDIFSMGCLFYYVLTDGEHPFGSLTYLRDGRIMDNQYDLSALDCSTNDGIEARDLVARMIAPNPVDRPTAVQVLRHPYFWDEKRRTDFILELSDRLNLEQRDPPSLLLQRVESASGEICGKDWTHKIDDAFMKDSRVNRSYDGKKINDLVRLIRNKKNHNHDLPESLRRKLNEFEPGGYIGYFLYMRFPKLLLHLYHICEDEELGIVHEAWYLSFWKNS